MSKDQRIERICQTCGKEFKVSPSRVKNGRGIYCSKSCLHNSDKLKEIGTNMGRANKGKIRPPFTEEHKSKIRKFQLKKHLEILCNFKYKGLWGEDRICKRFKKRYRKTCGNHVVSIQRYFQSKYYPHVYLDILAD